MTTKPYAVFGAILLAAAMWLWIQGIAIPHQQAEAEATGTPRGNLSDLYPRWLGARELLLNGRDPYGADITREIQAGYYGRPIDPARPHDPKDQQAFAYPLYVVFVLAPTVGLPFPVVQWAFLGLLIVLTVASVRLWMRALRWQGTESVRWVWIILALGCFPAIQGFKLQQLTLLVAAILALSMAAIAQRRLVAAGMLLAVATIKPQLVLIVVAWLCLWTLGKWRERQRLMWSFAVSMAILIVASELLLPGWIREFRQASAAYFAYTGGGRSVLDVELTPLWGRMLAGILVAAVLILFWRRRQSDEGSPEFRYCLALALATTLVVIPMFAPYNQLLLVPALMVIVRSIRALWERSRLSRFFVAITALSVFWPWMAAALLVLARLFLPASTIQRAWALPLYTSLTIPMTVLALLWMGGSVLRLGNPDQTTLSGTLRQGAASE